MILTSMKNSEQRINNIVGQLEGIKRLIKSDKRDCFQVITQLKAAKSAVASLMEKIISDELTTCVIPGKDNIKLQKIIKEITK